MSLHEADATDGGVLPRRLADRVLALASPLGGGDEAGRYQGQSVEESPDPLRAAQVIGLAEFWL
jgi:hypothetical protein